MLNVIWDFNEQNIDNNYDYALETYRDQLYLAIINYAAEINQYNQKILIYNDLTEQWQEIYQGYFQEETEINNNYQVTSFKLNNLDAKETLFVVFSCQNNLKILKLEENNIFTDVSKLYINFQKFINQKFISVNNEIYFIQNNNEIKNKIYWLENWLNDDLKVINDPNFFKNNESFVSNLRAYNNYLYVGIDNKKQGFEIWKTAINQENESHWQQVIIKGAYRYSLNAKISSLLVFKDSLYVTSGLEVDNKSLNKHKYYPQGFEIIRIYEDDDWDIIAGIPKFTPQGLKVPLSAQGAGFDNIYNCLAESLIIHQNQLYLFTQNLDALQVWHTENGEDWNYYTLKEDLNKYDQFKIINTLSCSWGLILITELNHFIGQKNVQICHYSPENS